MKAEISPSPSVPVLPALIATAGEKAAWWFFEFFTVNIRNRNTRAAYGRAAGAFLGWCEDRGILRIEDVQSVHVAGYIEQLGKLAWPGFIFSFVAGVANAWVLLVEVVR